MLLPAPLCQDEDSEKPSNMPDDVPGMQTKAFVILGDYTVLPL